VHILLIDDHAMFRQGLKFLLGELNADLQFSEAGSCEPALELIAEDPPSLILLDLNMPGFQGLGALHTVIAAAHAIPIAVLSGEGDPGLIRDAIDAGASGFVPKSSKSEILVAALKLILAGGVYLPTAALKQASFATDDANATVKNNKKANTLSARQTEVLLRAIKGQPNKIIAMDLGIAEGTVKTHLSGAFRTLGVRNRTEAVFAAAKLGLAPAP